MTDASETLQFPNLPTRLVGSDVERLFEWCVEQGTSDINLTTGREIYLEIHGKQIPVTKRVMEQEELMDVIVFMYESEQAKGVLSGNRDLDFGYEFRPDRQRRLRFRVNATAIQARGTRGLQITARIITAVPPYLKDMDFPAALREQLSPRQGMILVTGATGSGKSTLLAAIVRELLEDKNAHRKILTYEAPIEFVYDSVEMPTALVAQTEIPTHLESWAEAVRNALRRKPSIILLGEARDAETIGEAVVAAMTGHLMYTTVHSNGFADTIRRMVYTFPAEERTSRAVDIVSSLRWSLSQQLVPSTDGKRVPLREYVVFHDAIVDRILEADMDSLTAVCRDVLREEGVSFVQDATEKYREGRIDKRVFEHVCRSRGSIDAFKQEMARA